MKHNVCTLHNMSMITRPSRQIVHWATLVNWIVPIVQASKTDSRRTKKAHSIGWNTSTFVRLRQGCPWPLWQTQQPDTNLYKARWLFKTSRSDGSFQVSRVHPITATRIMRQGFSTTRNRKSLLLPAPQKPMENYPSPHDLSTHAASTSKLWARGIRLPSEILGLATPGDLWYIDHHRPSTFQGDAKAMNGKMDGGWYWMMMVCHYRSLANTEGNAIKFMAKTDVITGSCVACR